MKMLKKLLAVVLTGAMALTILTACGSNAATEKNIADAMNDIAKFHNESFTFTPRAKEREMARKIAALAESKMKGDDVDGEIKKILGYNEGGANENNFVWLGQALADESGTSGQALWFMKEFETDNAIDNAINKDNLEGKTPADTRYMGTALCKMIDKDEKPVTVRIIVVTAEAVAPEKT